MTMDSEAPTDRMAAARAAKAAKKAKKAPPPTLAAVEAAMEAASAPPVKLVPVKLLRNYRPFACVDEVIPKGKSLKTGLPIEAIRVKPFPAEHVVGWHRPATIRKDAAGKPVEVEPAMFIKGELPPSIRPGVGFEGKILAGAVIRVTPEEARHIKSHGIGEIEIDDD